MASSVVACDCIVNVEEGETKATSDVVRSLVSNEFKEAERGDPVLMQNSCRWVLFPVQYPCVWEMYKKHEASFWTTSEIDLSQDAQDWNKLV